MCGSNRAVPVTAGHQASAHLAQTHQDAAPELEVLIHDRWRGAVYVEVIDGR